ncbi:MAG TPA: hypothetical protein VER04_11275 [Polyangiaceae bacterium]|nr:hypothetical protein [Polyangiaceae bacterium]
MIFRHLLIALILVGFGAPWAVLSYRRLPTPDLESLIERICFGYAVSFALLFALSWLRLWLFVPVWGLGVAAATFDAFRRPALSRARLSLGKEGRVLLGAAALYFVARCLPFIVREAPLGWDAYFHMTIAESILERGRAISDWLPFENIPLNYPIGAHLFLALTEWLTHVRPHLFFELMVVWFTLLSGLQVFALSTRATQNRTLGCYAALSYLFLADMGSLQYSTWSGLPNLIGIYLLLGLLSELTTPAPSLYRATPAFVVYFLSACFVHHHVMVTAALTLGFVMAASFVSGDRATAKRIAFGLLASGVVGAPYFMIFLLRAKQLKQTGLGEHLEELPNAWDVLRDVGLGFVLPVAAGVAVWLKGNVRIARVPLFALLALLGLYLGVAFGVRTLSLALFDKEMAPFTPSRFLTDAVVLLALFAGVFFYSLQGQASSVRLPIVALIVAGFLFFNRASYADTFREELPLARRETYEWIAAHTDPSAALLDKNLHATYFTRRMSSGFPLPTSEFRALAANKIALEKIGHNNKRAAKWKRPLLAVVDPKAAEPKGTVVFTHASGIRVVELVGADGSR